MKYLRSCIWLTFPALLWNVVFGAMLPPAFQSELWNDIPTSIAIPEGVLRLVVFAAPLLMPLSLDTPRRRRGFVLFVAGTLIYFLSWVPLMAFPQSAWSLSPVGFMAPAYTPLVWLLGIALIGDPLFAKKLPYRWWVYALVCVLFLLFHNAHAWLVYSRLGNG